VVNSNRNEWPALNRNQWQVWIGQAGGFESELVVERIGILNHKAGLAGYQYIAGKFDSQEGFGPTCVRKFVEESHVLDERTPDQWQMDAFGQVDAWLRALRLRG